MTKTQRDAFHQRLRDAAAEWAVPDAIDLMQMGQDSGWVLTTGFVAEE